MSEQLELEHAIAEAARKEVVAGPQTEKIKSYLLGNLKPVRPLVPSGVFAGSFLLIFGVFALFSMNFLDPFGWDAMLPLQRLAMFFTLAASAGLLAFTLSRQMTPGTRVLPPGALICGLLVLLCLLVVALFQVQPEDHFMEEGGRCLRAGFPYAVPAAILFALILRKGAMLSPLWSGALTGMLAGLVSTTALEIHCPNQDLWHILIFHFGLAAAGAAAGAGLAWISRFFLHA